MSTVYPIIEKPSYECSLLYKNDISLDSAQNCPDDSIGKSSSLLSENFDIQIIQSVAKTVVTVEIPLFFQLLSLDRIFTGERINYLFIEGNAKADRASEIMATKTDSIPKGVVKYVHSSLFSMQARFFYALDLVENSTFFALDLVVVAFSELWNWFIVWETPTPESKEKERARNAGIQRRFHRVFLDAHGILVPYLAWVNKSNGYLKDGGTYIKCLGYVDSVLTKVPLLGDLLARICTIPQPPDPSLVS